MIRKIRVILLKLRLRLLACRIRRRGMKARKFEFRTSQMTRRFYFLESIKKDLESK